MTRALLLVGPVGCGKSTATNLIGGFGWSVRSMGEVARDAYEEVDTNLTLSEWAGERKRDDPAWCAKELMGSLGGPRDEVAIEGIRSMEEVDVFADHFDNVEIAWIWCPFYHRVERRVEGEDGRESDVQAFAERDLREWNWGIREIVEGKHYDWWVDNTGTLDDLSEQLHDICQFRQGDSLAPWHQFEKNDAILRNQGYHDEILTCLSTHRYDRICPQEVADTVGCTNETARKHLERFADDGTIKRDAEFNSVTFYTVPDSITLGKREGGSSTASD